ncbi:MAG: hypothetical protein ABL909_11045, partial [Sphingopyxis sp.]
MIRALTAALLLALLPATPAHAERPIAQFAAAPLIADPVMSPSGAKMAMILNVDGTQMLGVRNIVGAAAAPVLINTNGNEVHWVMWVNEDWLVVGVGHKETVGGDERYYTSTLAISADGRRNRVLESSSNVIWVARDGSARILLSFAGVRSGNVVYGGTVAAEADEIDLESGHRRVIARPVRGVWNWYADAQGNVRAGVGIRNDHHILVYRASNGDMFREVERTNAREREYVLVPLFFSADGTNATVIA